MGILSESAVADEPKDLLLSLVTCTKRPVGSRLRPGDTDLPPSNLRGAKKSPARQPLGGL